MCVCNLVCPWSLQAFRRQSTALLFDCYFKTRNGRAFVNRTRICRREARGGNGPEVSATVNIARKCLIGERGTGSIICNTVRVAIKYRKKYKFSLHIYFQIGAVQVVKIRGIVKFNQHRQTLRTPLSSTTILVFVGILEVADTAADENRYDIYHAPTAPFQFSIRAGGGGVAVSTIKNDTSTTDQGHPQHTRSGTIV